MPAMQAASMPPATPRKPVTDSYFGVNVADPYRWLEDPADPSVQAWSDAQNRFARSHLDAIESREALHKRVHDLLEDPSPSYFGLVDRRGHLFGLKLAPPSSNPCSY